MPRTTAFRRGDVVLVEFVFSDESGVKLRPALVVSSDGYHQGRREAIIAAITSHVGRRVVGDHPISDWKEAGLLFPSNVTGIIRTVKQAMLRRRLGSMAGRDLEAYALALRRSLDL